MIRRKQFYRTFYAEPDSPASVVFIQLPARCFDLSCLFVGLSCGLTFGAGNRIGAKMQLIATPSVCVRALGRSSSLSLSDNSSLLSLNIWRLSRTSPARTRLLCKVEQRYLFLQLRKK